MNYRFVIGQLGLVLVVLAGCMLVVTAFSALLWSGGNDDERLAMLSMLVSFAFTAGVGGALWLYGRQANYDLLGRREAILLVSMGWLIGAAVAGLPYYLWTLMEGQAIPDHPWRRFAACYFEAMSGLTTTGASVLSNIEAVPRGLLLWRSLTQWLGGLGIVVLFVAVLPQLGVGAKRLFSFEVSGPQKTGVRPRIAETARVLWLIYLTMTVAQVLCLAAAGVGWFDAINHTFTTLATGGFSTYSASIAAFDSVAVEVITCVFMVLAGVNFGLYYHLARRRFNEVLGDAELRLYLVIILIATVIVAFSIYGNPIVTTSGEVVEGDLGASIRHSAFQVISIITTTGYATADFDRWSFLPEFTLVALMFIGGCAGSTAGGMKVIRVLIAAKILLAEIERAFRPAVVRPVRIGRSAIDAEQRQSVLAYMLAFLGLFVLGTLLLMVFEQPEGRLDFVSALTASAATINVIGPGLGQVGPTQNFGFFSAPSLVVMSLLMVLGRLEIFTILALFTTRFWRQE